LRPRALLLEMSAGAPWQRRSNVMNIIKEI